MTCDAFNPFSSFALWLASRNEANWLCTFLLKIRSLKVQGAALHFFYPRQTQANISIISSTSEFLSAVVAGMASFSASLQKTGVMPSS
jgi:hypothetical protein